MSTETMSSEKPVQTEKKDPSKKAAHRLFEGFIPARVRKIVDNEITRLKVLDNCPWLTKPREPKKKKEDKPEDKPKEDKPKEEEKPKEDKPKEEKKKKIANYRLSPGASVTLNAFLEYYTERLLKFTCDRTVKKKKLRLSIDHFIDTKDKENGGNIFFADQIEFAFISSCEQLINVEEYKEELGVKDAEREKEKEKKKDKEKVKKVAPLNFRNGITKVFRNLLEKCKDFSVARKGKGANTPDEVKQISIEKHLVTFINELLVYIIRSIAVEAIMTMDATHSRAIKPELIRNIIKSKFITNGKMKIYVDNYEPFIAGAEKKYKDYVELRKKEKKDKPKEEKKDEPKVESKDKPKEEEKPKEEPKKEEPKEESKGKKKK